MNITVEDCSWFASHCGVKATRHDLWGSPKTGVIRYHFKDHHMWVDKLITQHQCGGNWVFDHQLLVTFDDLIMEAGWSYSYDGAYGLWRGHHSVDGNGDVVWVGEEMSFHMVLAQWKMEDGG